MRTFVEHQRAVRELLAPLHASLEAAEGAEVLALDAVSGPHGRVRAHGRVLADDVLAPGDLPAFANSQMDGYAVASADLAAARPEKPVELPVGRTTAAGDPIRTHARGTASPVMTGAAVPHGADAIVPVEAADPPRFPGLGGGAHDVPPGTTVRFAHPVEPGTFVRAIGTDVARGAVLLPAGARLGPAQLGTLAAGRHHRGRGAPPHHGAAAVDRPRACGRPGRRSNPGRSTTRTPRCCAARSTRPVRSCATPSPPTTPTPSSTRSRARPGSSTS